MTDIDPMRLVGHLKNLLRYGRASVSLTALALTPRMHIRRERLGLKGLISLRLLAKDKPASSEAEAEGQPLDPKKTLREQGVFDGCDILVTQVRCVSCH
jgi:hypothetical protein